MRQRGFAPIFILLIVAFAVLAGGLVFYLKNNPVSVSQSTSTDKAFKTTIKFLSINETEDGLVYTTNVPTYSRVDFWIDPKLVNTAYGDGFKTNHEYSTMNPGTTYQITVFLKDPTDGIKSETYSFKGDTQVYPKSSDSNQVDLSGNKFDLTSLKVGDKIGQLTVKTIEPYDSNYGGLSVNNFKIAFTGQISLTGQYYIDQGINTKDPNRNISFIVDDSSVQLLPQETHIGDYGYLKTIAFNDYDSAYKLLYPLGQAMDISVTIVVDNYNLINYLPVQTKDTADLVQAKQSKE